LAVKNSFPAYFPVYRAVCLTQATSAKIRNLAYRDRRYDASPIVDGNPICCLKNVASDDDDLSVYQAQSLFMGTLPDDDSALSQMDSNDMKKINSADDDARKSTSGTLVGESTERKLHIDHNEEQKLLLKLDLHIAPIVMILYLIAFLDRYLTSSGAINNRSNIGYASVQGLNADIGLTGDQFNVATSIFYVTYVCIETPAAIFVKKAKFSRMIPAIAMAWGLVCLCTGFIQNYAGLLVTRLLLGAAEGGLFPALTLYLMSWYKRDELAKRMCFLFGICCPDHVNRQERQRLLVLLAD
jgi:hypothetical protein